MKVRNNFRYSIIVLILLISACSSDKFSDIEIQKTDINIVRFEKDLFEINLYTFEDSVKHLISKHPDFIPLFGNKIIQIGDPRQEWFVMGLKSFVTDQAIHNMNRKVMETFPDMTNINDELTNSFGRWKTVFPEKPVPNIYTYISGFNQSIVTTENILGISLEKYLGADNELYNQVYPPLSEYQKYTMTPEKVPSDIMRAWTTTELNYSPEQDNLLSQMIFNGQIMYLTSKLLPDTPDTLLWGFTPEQMNFCNNNEPQMWTYLIEHKLLFSTDNFKIAQFMEERPFTKDFTNESPGRAAIWIGYRIVENYAKNNKDLSLRDIVSETNYQKILTQSKYRP